MKRIDRVDSSYKHWYYPPRSARFGSCDTVGGMNLVPGRCRGAELVGLGMICIHKKGTDGSAILSLLLHFACLRFVSTRTSRHR